MVGQLTRIIDLHRTDISVILFEVMLGAAQRGGGRRLLHAKPRGFSLRRSPADLLTQQWL